MRLATRGSPLALWQAQHVATLVRGASPGTTVELVVVETTGDVRQDQPVWELSGQGVFVKEVQAAVLDGRADAAVHSAKDLPSQTAPGLRLVAVPGRADPRDVLVSAPGLAPGIEGLAPGATIATGSVRRRAQLAARRTDLTFASLRGNIATRLDRIPRSGAVVMAAAALDRLALSPATAETLDPSVMLPQVGQGAIAVECRAEDPAWVAVLESIDQPATHLCIDAERAFLARIGGGCDLPVGAYARLDGETLVLEALIASLDGRVVLRDRRNVTLDGDALAPGAAAFVPGAAAPAGPLAAGAELADALLASGGAQLLADSGATAPPGDPTP